MCAIIQKPWENIMTEGPHKDNLCFFSKEQSAGSGTISEWDPYPASNCRVSRN